ncbi:MAG: type IV secretion system DNA-binding domain-containing protein [Chloroflexi bacterium]|nr:type IV secretion system DNA-binding domain-containing protein [Chloroflexota bacterium]
MSSNVSNRMPTRVPVSLEAHEKLRSVQGQFLELGQLGTIYRIAALLSLKRNGYQEERPAEMTLDSERIHARLRGPLEIHHRDLPIIFPALVQLSAGKTLDPEDIYRQVSYHIHLGAELLEDVVKDVNSLEGLYELLMDEVPDGFETEMASQFHSDGNGMVLRLGEQSATEEPYDWPLTDTSQTENPHACIVGVSGQGKTQFALDILYQIRQQNPDVSFTIMDYKGDLSEPGSSSRRMLENHLGCDVITAGKEAIRTVPFQNVSSQQNDQYVVGVTDLIAKFYPSLGGQQRYALRQCLEELIATHSGGFGFNTLEKKVEEFYEENGRNPDGLSDAVHRLSVSRAFEDSPSSLMPEPLITQSLSLRLNELEFNSLPIAFLVVNRLYDEMKQLPDAERQGSVFNLRHVVFIDEAHHYLSVKSSPLALLIREGRSKGVAVLLATQSVSDLSGTAGADYRQYLSNSFFFKTNLNSASEIRAMLPASGQQVARIADQIATLETGQMLFSRNIQKEPSESVLQAVQFYRRGL